MWPWPVRTRHTTFSGIRSRRLCWATISTNSVMIVLPWMSIFSCKWTLCVWPLSGRCLMKRPVIFWTGNMFSRRALKNWPTIWRCRPTILEWRWSEQNEKHERPWQTWHQHKSSADNGVTPLSAFCRVACCLAVHMKDEQRFEMQPEIVGWVYIFKFFRSLMMQLTLRHAP